jgi:hypothetical protein
MSLEIYRNDAKIRYTTMGDVSGHAHGKKENITMLSKASLGRLVFLVQNTDIEFTGMTTLTYPSIFPENGKECKKHLNRFLSWYRVCGIGEYVWFMEFQKRGAPHFHILHEDDMSKIAKSVSKAWYEAVGSNDPKHLKAGTRTEKIRQSGGARNYAAKYGAKKEQKSVPPQFSDVGRFWGASRGVKVQPLTSIEIHDMQVIMDTLESVGWEYAANLEKMNLSTLYNAGKLLNNEVTNE